jgi:MFS family permease
LLVLLLFAASAPSPLYAIYQANFAFSAITLTAVYASYALGGVVALLFAGRLSDHFGRRPVLLAGLAIDIASMLTFVAATNVPMLFLGRIVAGVGTALGAGVVSAWLLDLRPGDAKLASVLTGVCTLLGLGVGAFVSGLFVEFGPDPLHLIFWVLAVAYAIAAVAVLVIPEPISRRGGWLGSMRPMIGVPAVVRPMFMASAPALVGMWALTGLYLSLGPSLAISVLEAESRLAGGAVILALAGAGAVSSYAFQRGDPAATLVRGCVILLAGVAVTLVGVWLSSAPLLFAGSVVAGAGLGPAFAAFVRIVAPLAPAESRGALIGAIYVVTYLSFSVPAAIGGAAVSAFGLRETTFGYGGVVMTLAGATTFAVSRRMARVRSPVGGVCLN